MAEDYEAILRKHDDPIHWEQPPGFDRAAAVGRFKDTHRALEQALDMTLEAETGNEDASFHSQIRMGVFDGELVVIRFSNFGDMVAISGEECLPAHLHDHVKETLGARGYVYIPEAVLGPYTGENPGVTGIRDWWIRYFDWV